jgi:peptide/nickel transport system substrate-binding protein
VSGVKRRGARSGALAALIVVWLAAGLPTGPAAAAPASAEVVRLPFPQYDGTLTPYTFELGYPLVTLVYDTLLWRDASGAPQPWLARSVTRSDDGRRLTVRLRDDVRWHDGRPLTAEDVAFTFEYIAENFQPRFTPQLAGVEAVRATDRLTATIDLRRPSLGFEDQPLADMPILPRHLWDELPEGSSAPRGLPVGSGPYRLVSAERDAGYVLRANRDYFKGRPRVGEIRVPIITDAQRTYDALRERRVDMVPLSLPPEAGEDFEATLGIGVRRGPSYSGTTLLLNTRRPPFDRPEVRRAVAAALDLGLIARNVAPSEAAAEGYIHPESRWAAGVPLQRYDLRAARRTLASLDLAPMRILASESDAVRLQAAEQVVLALRRAGAEATLVELSSARLGEAIGEDGSTADFDAAIQSIPALASQDPDFLATLFGSAARSAPLNFSGYSSETFDALARDVASAPDTAARREATREELALLARDAPSIPLFFSEGAFAYRPAIYDGWSFIQGIGILDKRSFLPGGRPERPAPPDVPTTGGEQADSGWGLSLVNAISIVLLAAVVVLAAVALLQRRSGGGR